MILIRMACCALAIFAVTASSVRADDPCLGDEEEKAAKAAIAAMSKAEKSGQTAELFVASRAIADDDCIDRFDKNAQARAKANVPKLGRELAKAAEAKGFLYSHEPVRADGRTSAFRYFEAIGDFNEANRVMLKAVHAKPDDPTLFETAWGVDRGRHGPRDPKTGEIQPHTSPPAYHEALRHIASTNADQLMKAEERDAKGLSGSAQEATKASMGSLREAGEGLGLDEVSAERRQVGQGEGRAAGQYDYEARRSDVHARSSRKILRICRVLQGQRGTGQARRDGPRYGENRRERERGDHAEKRSGTEKVQ